MRGIARSLLVLTLVCGAPFGCDDGAVSGPAPSSFPVRVLQDLAGSAGDEHVVFVDELDSLEGWWALSFASDGKPNLSRAPELAASGGLSQSEGAIVLPAGTVLLRRVELEQTTEHALTARLRGGEAVAGEGCPNLLLLPAASPSGEEFLEVEQPGPEQLRRLTQTLAEAASAAVGPETAAGRPRAVWRQSAGAADFALARCREWVDVSTARGPSRWIALVARDRPLEVDRVRVTKSPELHAGSDTSTELSSESHEIVIERVRLGGDSRVAAFVPPERVLSLPIVVPRQAVDFVLGACPDPAAVARLAPGDRRTTRWSVRVQPGDHLLAEVDETSTAGRPAGFTDHVLAWPSGLAGELTVELRVNGSMGMVFGQPRVRGPERVGSPSLLLVSIDTLRADHLGFLGYERPTSPFLDELAARAAVFTDVTAVSSYTLPTHASLFTGLFPPRHLALDTSDRINTQRTPTLAVLLAQAGFATAGFTGGGFVSGEYGFDDGFDRYTTADPVDEPPARKGRGLEVISEWIRRQGRRSWFTFVHTYATHDYEPPAEDLRLFARGPAPEGFDVYELLDQRDLAAAPPTRAELDHLVDLYDASIHRVDRRLRALIEPLRAEGLLDDTWIVITSDHGEAFFEHAQLRHGVTLYQELVGVPLLVVPPAGATGAAGRRIDEPVSQVDSLPTLLELLGCPVPEDLDGRSLAEFVRGGRAPGQPTPLYSQLDRSLHARSALRTGPWKLVHGDTSSARAEPATKEWELFDLAHDAGERQNLEAERGEQLEPLRLRLAELEAALHGQAGARTSFEPDDELMQRLAELGYVEPSAR